MGGNEGGVEGERRDGGRGGKREMSVVGGEGEGEVVWDEMAMASL